MTDRWTGSWIWAAAETPIRNIHVDFRRAFEYRGGEAKIRLTADTRYCLWVNGEYVGQGPVREWTAHWRYDEYDLVPYLKQGKNAVAITVNHFGVSTFQYIMSSPGLLAEIDLNGDLIVTDDSWKATVDCAFNALSPRISCQEAFEEQFDARLDDEWRSGDYDDTAWPKAVVLRPAVDGLHGELEERYIPYLTSEPISPQRVISVESVRPMPYIFNFFSKTVLAPEDRLANHTIWHAYVATQIHTDKDLDLEMPWVFNMNSDPKVNGVPIAGKSLPLKAGWNTVVFRITGSHFPDHSIVFNGPEGIRFSCDRGESSPSWAIIGPFGLPQEDIDRQHDHMDESVLVINPSDPRNDTGVSFWDSCDVQSVVDKPYFRPLAGADVSTDNVFVRAYTGKVVNPSVVIEKPENLTSETGWTTVNPDPDGNDIQILLDFGRELIGHHRFDVVAPEGTVIDFHNFEFIQPDGRYNLAEGMYNSSRYICREGRQSYRTEQRRGLRYSYMILRNLTGPVRIGSVELLFSTYPQTNSGSFACSDEKLNRIWKVGADTMRCCAEDTYTDCPTYEQTHWVGDARNEALVDWVTNGDPRLWYRCIEQAGRSLERSYLVESNVPSGWTNILPAWSVLWMRSCREYLTFTGDVERGKALLGYVGKNIEGILSHLDQRGLFNVHAWNMFDWAAMDTPTRGAVAHLNCLIVLALKDASIMADLLGSSLGTEWRAAAESLDAAINLHFWNEEKQAYTDCLRGDVQSPVFSQQTQTAAYLSGVAKGERGMRCRDILYNPPSDFVKSGSPFFEFFLLEALQGENRVQEFLDIIRRDWGFMIDMGATSFWEMWSGCGPDGRLTRSHCHGWSSAPTYFLSTYILGVTPKTAGFDTVLIEPHPGDLKWCRGAMPTPHGNVEVQWDNDPEKPFVLRLKAPDSVKVEVKLPREGEVVRS